MNRRITRRHLLTMAGGAGVAGVAGAHLLSSEVHTPVDVRGAVYLPTRAFNHYQTWQGYDRAVIERDLRYATRVNLNALRVWLSYEFWREDPNAVQQRFDHFLDTADQRGIRVLISLFDSLGAEPTRENLTTTDPLTAVLTCSPSSMVMRNRDRWDEPRQYIEWFMSRYRNDDRLLAIELTNEPDWQQTDILFAKGMFETLAAYQGSVPLTIGASDLRTNAPYLQWIDVLQVHWNFPSSAADYRWVLQQANEMMDRLDKPVWMTEWQRIRPDGDFFAHVEGQARLPNYSSLAQLNTDLGVGNFFWSLMVKPAVTPPLRRMGVINGLFHEDGAVWSRDDARAINAMSGEPVFEGNERAEMPEWAATTGS